MRRPEADRARRELSCMIRVDGVEYCIDPAGGIADTLGKKWTLPLIGILGNRAVNRFADLRRDLEGIGAKALSDRLRDLERRGLVSRAVFAEVPARVEYRLTAKGDSLRRAIAPLLHWATREDAGAEGRR